MDKPMPQPTATTAPFWDALRHRELRMQHCGTCSQWVWYPRPHCPHCGGGELTWRPLSGDARLYSFCISTRPTAPAFADETPQLLAYVELAEGPRLATTLVGAAEDPWTVGMALRPYFDMRGAYTLLRFQVAD